MARRNLYDCDREYCATAPYLCQMYNHRKWRATSVGYWLSFDWLVWKLHEVFCPDSKTD